MRPETFRFRFNGLAPMRRYTMQEAVDKCRENALNGRTTCLQVLAEGDQYITLATYFPLPENAWEKYRENPKDEDSPLVPQVAVHLNGYE